MQIKNFSLSAVWSILFINEHWAAGIEDGSLQCQSTTHKKITEIKSVFTQDETKSFVLLSYNFSCDSCLIFHPILDSCRLWNIDCFVTRIILDLEFLNTFDTFSKFHPPGWPLFQCSCINVCACASQSWHNCLLCVRIGSAKVVSAAWRVLPDRVLKSNLS